MTREGCPKIENFQRRTVAGKTVAIKTARKAIKRTKGKSEEEKKETNWKEENLRNCTRSEDCLEPMNGLDTSTEGRGMSRIARDVRRPLR